MIQQTEWHRISIPMFWRSQLGRCWSGLICIFRVSIRPIGSIRLLVLLAVQLGCRLAVPCHCSAWKKHCSAFVVVVVVVQRFWAVWYVEVQGALVIGWDGTENLYWSVMHHSQFTMA